MDRNELNLKMEELKAAMHNRDFEKAVDIADTLELKKIKDNNFLSLVADAYELTHNYKEAKKILLLAYENTNAGRHLAYRLCLVSIKNKEFDEAREFYEDFVEMAPRDTTRYILKYKMAKAKGSSIEKLIEILEEYVNIDMDEKWAFELAKLYHMAGDEERCVDMCDEISLWFAEGKYVAKAMGLKQMYRPLTAAQKQKLEESKRKNEEVAAKAEAEEMEKQVEATQEESTPKEIEEIQEVPEIKIKHMDEEKFNTMDIQAVVANGMKEVQMQENVNIHEEEGATKVAPDISGNGDMEEIKFDVPEIENDEELEELDELDEMEEETVTKEVQEEIIDEEESQKETVSSEESQEEETVDAEESQKEETIEAEPLKDIKGVEDILRQLQERGILKAETVRQAVNIIDEAGKTKTEEDIKPEVSTFERWEEDNEPENVVEAPESVEIKAEPSEPVIVSEEIEGVPVLDLSFETPKRDESNDIGQENMYEDIVANSDLGNSTDKLPSKEEIEAAIKNAEQKVEETSEEQAEDLDVKIAEDLHSTQTLSAKVEIISGTDWKQPERNEELIMNNEESKVDSDEGLATEEHVETKLTLSEEELSAFKNYLNVEGFEANIREILEQLIVDYNPNGKSENGNVVIMGAGQTGKTTLAIEIIKLVNKKRGRRDRKLAKIDAEVLNRRGFRKPLNKLLGSDLIIENAQNLGAMTVSEIVDVCGMFTDDMLIILEGEAQGIEQVMSSAPRLAEVFNHVIKIKEYDIKEWVEYGIRYAGEQGYSVDALAKLAFHKAIDDFFGANKGIGQSDVENIIDEAIARSNRFGRKLSGIFSSKKDEEGLNILVESDFNI